MSYTDAERERIKAFHARKGSINAENINELAATLQKTSASVRAVAVRMGLYTAKAGSTKSKSGGSTSHENLLIAQDINDLIGLNLESLTRMTSADLTLLRGHLQCVHNQW